MAGLLPRLPAARPLRQAPTGVLIDPGTIREGKAMLFLDLHRHRHTRLSGSMTMETVISNGKRFSQIGIQPAGTMAEPLGVTFQQVQKYEKGTNRGSPSRLVAIAAALDAPVTFFFPPEVIGDRRAGRSSSIPAPLSSSSSPAIVIPSTSSSGSVRCWPRSRFRRRYRGSRPRHQCDDPLSRWRFLPPPWNLPSQFRLVLADLISFAALATCGSSPPGVVAP